MRPANHFRKLDVYQGAMSLVLSISELTRHFPTKERFSRNLMTPPIRFFLRSLNDLSNRPVGNSISEEPLTHLMILAATFPPTPTRPYAQTPIRSPTPPRPYAQT